MQIKTDKKYLDECFHFVFCQDMARGSLIVFEGCDKSGKSTQCKKLVEALNKREIAAEQWRFPERSTKIGQIINSYMEKECELHDVAVHLLFSANRWEFLPLMKEKIEQGTTIVVDRYAYSGVAFTSAKGYDIEWCKACDRGLPMPDQVFCLDIPIDEASTRGDFGRERYEVSDFQKVVRKKFGALKDESWQVIDARDTFESIHKKICDATVEIIINNQNKNLDMSLFM